jgi:16S rRNA (guanine(527)-N(7))-methyltransferase RsmG
MNENSVMESKNGLKRLLEECDIPIMSEPAIKLGQYLKLLEKWNAKINLTAKTDWESLETLFREGIWAANKYLAKFHKHLDIGSGAGFPGIIIHCFFPDTSMEMVESRNKKGAFLETVAFELRLKKLQIKVLRLDAMLKSHIIEDKWDCISWKAIKIADNDLLELIKHTHKDTEFWMFHGKEYAVEKPATLTRLFQQKEKLSIPGTKDSFLSIFKIKHT